MKLESGIELTARAVKRLLDRKSALGLPDFHARTLGAFVVIARGQKMAAGAKETICDQAILILDQFYAHLAFKRARYAIDPVQRLRLLRSRLDQYQDDLRFHSEVLRIFTELRDAHTLYGLPPPYRGAMAFLPFVMKHYTDEYQCGHFVVTQTLAGLEHSFFRPGVEITYWNGMPIADAVERTAASVAAGNAASKFARSFARMTSRHLTYNLPPGEEMVFVGYRAENEDRVLVLPWYVATGFPDSAFRTSASAICQPVADGAAMRGVIWSEDWTEQRELQESEERAATERQGLGAALIFGSLDEVPAALREDFLFTRLPKNFEFQHPSGFYLRRAITPDELMHEGKRFGYLRIKTFDTDSDDALVNEFQRILEVMNEFAPDGLVLDVRANPGGSLKAAERLLQMLTPRFIEPALFHFANTPTIQKILGGVKRLASDDAAEERRIRELKSDFAPWIEDAVTALAEGLQMTEGRVLTPMRVANSVGQVYQGPVALVVDAVSYSATDFFAAGFQDHEIGEIIGVDENTGGGGASRWWHQNDLFGRLQVMRGMPVEELPGGATIAFARLRSTRRGLRAGQALEDVGVGRTIPYRLTKRDLMDWGSDLVKFACRHLAGQPAYRLTVKRAAFVGDKIQLRIETRGLTRVAVYVNSVPQFADGASASGTLEVPLDGLDPRNVWSLDVQGYAWREPYPAGELTLVARAKCKMPLAVEEPPTAP